jgi:amino acid adenylation domain-containing protein
MEHKKHELAQRFARLSTEKQKAFLALLQQQKIDFARLPIVAAQPSARGALSYAQVRQWFLWQLDPQSTAYHIGGALMLAGRLDVNAVRASFSALVERHESLRTVFRPADGGAAEAVIREGVEPGFTVLDLGGVTSQDEREARSKAEAGRLSRTPFDLAEGPLLRVGLVRLAQEEHMLVVVMHHIVSDGASMQILVNEFVAQYAARVQGGVPVLQPLPVQYADYAAWQRNWLEAGERERQLAYWTKHVGTEQPVLQLPADHARRTDGRYSLARHAFELPPALAGGLLRRAQAQGATLFMTLLAGFQVLLSRYTGQPDVRVGVPIANRHRAETEGVIGFFVNTQVLRSVLDVRESLSQVLARAKDAALGAQAHQDLPFEQLVEALQPDRVLGANPLFQVLFNHQRGDAGALQGMPGLSLTECDLGVQAAQFELTLETTEDADGRVQASLRYASELFEPQTMARMAGHYLAVLSALADHPEQTVGDVALLGEAEEAQMHGWGVNARRHDAETPVHRLFERQARQTPEAVALVFGDEALSYAQLDARANRLAHRLMALGVKPESMVGIAAERSIDMVVGLLAILKAGGAYVPLDPEYPPDRLAYMVASSGIRLLLAQSHQHELVAQLSAAAEGLRVLALDTLPTDDELANAPADAPADPPASDPQVPSNGHNLAYVIYTSGSTGKPKGVMVRHAALSHFLSSMREAPGLSADDVLVAVTSLSFDIAALELYLPLVCGARLVLAAKHVARDGEALGRLLRDSGATVLQSTPSGWRLLEADLRLHGRPARLKGLCGGEALQADLAHSLCELGIELWNMYGPTETTIWSTADRVNSVNSVNDVRGMHGVPAIGSAIADTQVRVLDEALNLAPAGVAGELYLGGIGLARGYFGRAALSAERFVADPFDTAGGRLYRTGDLVRWSGQGRLEYLGRIDHQVKIRGFRIELGEIETQLLAQPEVREAVVVAGAGPAGARLVGYVSLHGAQAIEAPVLRERLGSALPDYMVPSVIVVLGALPLNPNGKVDRKALPPPEFTNDLAYEAPQGELEEALAAIWAQVLGVPRVGRNDNFFEIGGHSLLATQIASRVRAARNIELPLRRVFEHPVLHALASHLQDAHGVHHAGSEAVAVPVLEPVARAAQMKLSPAQQRLWLVDRLSGKGAAYNITAALRLRGALDADVLRATLDAIVARHEVLRTTYPQDDEGEPVACVQLPGPLAVPLHDLTGLAPAQQEAGVQAAQDAHARTVFDLAAGPLLAATVLRTAPETHLLLLCVHHIVFDGWSESIFVQDFMAIYAALRERRHASLPPLRVQYADYADWHHRKLAQRFAPESAFWRGYLDGAPALSTFSSDHARPRTASTAGDAVAIEVDKELAQALGVLARRHGTSLYTLLLSVFLLMLHRQAGSNDVVVGTDVAGRGHPDLEKLIGFFVGVVPLRSRLAPRLTFAQWLAQVKESTLSAFEHQDVPFEQIVELAGVPRSQQHNPLVQVLFVMQNMPASRLEIPGIVIEAVEQPVVASKFDLAVFVSESTAAGTGFTANWVYATSLYRRESIEQAAAAWRDLLQQVATSPTGMLENLVIPIPLETPTMSSPSPALGKLQKLKKLVDKDRTGAPAPHLPVRTSFLSPQRNFPLVIEATGGDIDAVAWAREQREFIEASLRTHGGILLRNFGLRTPQEFEAFAEVIEPELYGSYGDLPKKEGGKKTYRSTPYPERQMILYHNESSHLDRWPRKQWFFCELPSPVGGATPIVDCREMLRRLPGDVVAGFERKGLLYVRTFTPNFDVSWQTFFKTDSRAEVEARLAAADIGWRWLDEDTLQTRTRCPAVITHPVTGDRVFFNQVQLHHVSCLEPDVREDLVAMAGLDRMPRHVTYGDGSPIADETMAVVGRAYEECAVRFDWRQGDVVMLDNMLAAHARDPYEGPRKIVVAMGAMCDRAALEAPPDRVPGVPNPSAQAALALAAGG